MQTLTKPLFVIGDVHGCFNELIELMNHWDEKTEQLVFIGDYIDRGPDSFAVLQYVKHLVRTKGAWALKGNHEDMFNQANDIFNEKLFLKNGGQQTIDSFPTIENIWEKDVESIKEHFPEINQFMKNLPDFIETKHIIFAHAGIEPFQENWQEYKTDCLWIRDDFHWNKTKDRRLIVFGHTPTTYLNKDESMNVWKQDNKLGIDGGCVFGGQLHGVRLTHTGLLKDVVSVKKHTTTQ